MGKAKKEMEKEKPILLILDACSVGERKTDIVSGPDTKACTTVCLSALDFGWKREKNWLTDWLTHPSSHYACVKYILFSVWGVKQLVITDTFLLLFSFSKH